MTHFTFRSSFSKRFLFLCLFQENLEILSKSSIGKFEMEIENFFNAVVDSNTRWWKNKKQRIYKIKYLNFIFSPFLSSNRHQTKCFCKKWRRQNKLCFFHRFFFLFFHFVFSKNYQQFNEFSRVFLTLKERKKISDSGNFSSVCYFKLIKK